MKIKEKLKIATNGKIGLCVGLDPVIEKIPAGIQDSAEPFYEFCKEIIHATADYAAAYKPNVAFFEALGADGWLQLQKVIAEIPENKIAIADAKRGDIGNTAKAYARSLFGWLKADMATVSPYLGSDSLEPFLGDAEHGVFVLAVTSNAGGKDFQELICDGKPLFHHIIKMARNLNSNENIGLVVGATRASLWPEVTELAVDMPLLVPGIGAQGGDIDALKSAVKTYSAPVLVNSSRGIIYASSGKDFAESAARAAQDLVEQLKF